MKITERKTCRACNTELPDTDLASLGNQTIVDFLSDGEKGRGEAPLSLVYCNGCGLVQLRHSVDPDTLYRTFWYRSGINEQMRAALLELQKSACKRADLTEDDVVMDIGSNDGTLLGYYAGPKCVGFDPATDVVKEARVNFPEITFVDEYFNAADALRTARGKKYKIITAVAMFYDLEDPGKFLDDIAACLTEDGVFVVQMNYLYTMIKNMAFDNVGHEHLCYYSLSTLARLFAQHGLVITDAELNGVNGGSIRVYAKKETGLRGTKVPMSSSIEDILRDEHYQHGELTTFGMKTWKLSYDLLKFLQRLKWAGKVVYAYGASTRGSTLLQTVFSSGQLRARDVLEGVAERDPNKYGRTMAGLGLPIVTEEVARARADYFLILPYHFWESISKREKAWMEKGGKAILPVPRLKVVSLQSLSGGAGSLISETVEDEITRLGL